LVADDLDIKTMPVQAVPEGALREIGDAVGQLTLVDLYPGEVILAQRLADPNIVSGDGRLALVMAEEQVLMAFPAEDLMSRVGILKPGDHIDLLFSLDIPIAGISSLTPGAGEMPGTVFMAAEDEEQATFSVLQNVTIAAIVEGTTPTRGTDENEPAAILLTVSPQDALILKYVKDAEGIVDIVLRAPGVESPFTTEPVDIDYIINRFQIPTGARR
jgi:pilus assembly protein CpaB